MTTVRLLATAEVPGQLLEEIRGLLDAAFDDGFSDDDWEHTLGGWHAVGTVDGVLVSHAAVVPRLLVVGDRPLQTGYLESVATAPTRRRHGHGTFVAARVTELVRDEFDMGALSTARHGFYERLGWQRWQGPTFVRHGTQRVRTPDEDSGIMVLRFGPSEDVDPNAPISCAARSGDDW